MKKENILLFFAGFFAFSFLNNAGAQNPYVFLLDSTYIYNWDSTAQNWDLSQKQRFSYTYSPGNKLIEVKQYDNSGSLISIESRSYTDSSMVRIITNPVNGSWINWRKHITLYDDMQKIAYTETYVWDNNEWIRADKVFYKYDDDDHLVQLIRRFLFDGLFQDVQQTDYIYDQDSHLIVNLITDMITNTPIRRTLFTNNSIGQRTEGLLQSWIAGIWSNSGKVIYSYNPCGQIQEMVNQVYFNNIFVNSSRSLLFYSPHFFDFNTRKVAVCHNGHTIYVSKNAVRAHLAHGDCLGECSSENHPERHCFDEKEKHEKPPFTIYPNPAREKIIIRFDRDECSDSRRVELTDFYGKPIRTFNIRDNGDLTIYRGNLLSGKYFVRLIGEQVYSAGVIFE